MRGGFSRYIGPGLGEPRMTLWISEQPHSLSLNHWSFILIFSLYLVFSTIFSVLILPVVLLNLKPSILRVYVSACPGAPEVLFRLGSVTSVLAQTLHQGIPDSNHKLWNIVSTERYLLHMQVLLECCYIFSLIRTIFVDFRWKLSILSGLWRCICVCIAIHHVSENALGNNASKR
jgi:hypothetical protein